MLSLKFGVITISLGTTLFNNQELDVGCCHYEKNKCIGVKKDFTIFKEIMTDRPIHRRADRVSEGSYTSNDVDLKVCF